MDLNFTRGAKVRIIGGAHDRATGVVDSHKPTTIRGETIPNQVVVSPMCQYSCEGEDGRSGTGDIVHMGSRAVGGAGLVMVEATAVQPEGRITPWDSLRKRQ